MCGIAGIIDLKNRPVQPQLLKQMADTLIHRGPDDERFYYDHIAGLAQRRLSIIDLAGGAQPMSNEDGSVWVTFNGEIYNYQQVRPHLQKLGHTFATASDTEVILHGYEQYGADCVIPLRGMFAFALWDENTHTLLLARDRVGKKPLFYTEADGQFLFASELQAIIRHPAVRRQLDPIAIDQYLTYGYIPAPGTIFHRIHKLPPAHWLRLTVGAEGGIRELRVERYWELEYTPKRILSEQAAGAELLELLTESVRLRLIADVPLGALLSGGTDSSLVVALMSKLNHSPVKTFSIGFTEQAFNELPHARRVAERFGTDHHELTVTPHALEILPTLVRHYGEPFADSSAIPTYYLAQHTRKHVTVALNGDGGDENMAGYDRYLGSGFADTYQSVPLPLRQHIAEPIAALIPDGLPRQNRLGRVKRFFNSASLPFAQRYLRWVTYFTPEQKCALYSPEFSAQLQTHDGTAWLLEQFDQSEKQTNAHHSRLDTVLGVDVRSYLAYDLLVKMDIATMANSLEARSPLLDHKVMEFCAQLPDNLKIRGGTSKYLLKKVASRLLPAENIYRPKMGFGVPVGEWMRGELRPLVQDTLLSARAAQRGYFDSAAVRRLADDHMQCKQDYSYQLWALLWLELWHREFID
jgi:asparagine synthase (glutamine-hydrolysing)